MPLQGPMLVVAEKPATDVIEMLTAGGAFPIVEVRWAEATAALAEINPAAVLIADPDELPEPELAAAFGAALAAAQPFVPVVARMRPDASPVLANAVPIAADVSARALRSRLRSAMRLRTLHATVLRRMDALVEQGRSLPQMSELDPLDDAFVLVTGRGRSYPALSVAIGEQVGLVGALSVETAARHLNARDFDGVVIGDGFSPVMVDAFLTALSEDVRFRDMPVALLSGHPGAFDHYELPNLQQVADVDRLVERVLPLVRLHAFEARLKRLLRSLDAEGMIDPQSGLLTQAAFARELARAVRDTEHRGTALSVARFSFEVELDRRASLEAARLVGRLVRNVDFACREDDGSVVAVFTECDLRTAHVIARRIASVLKHTLLIVEGARARADATVTLATLKPSDDALSLLARVAGDRAATG
jgi:GGDEF domain-containing protein